MPEPATVEPNLWNDVQPILDQELSRLPEKYRIPILLCDLEGRTRKEAAQQLRLPEGTVASRLVRAREMLAKRLARQGVGVAGAALAGVLIQSARSAELPPSVVSATLDAARLFAAGRGISAKVAIIADGVLKAMLLRKLVGPTLALFAVLLLVGVGAYGQMTPVSASSKQRGSPVAIANGASSSQSATANKAAGMHDIHEFHLHLIALVKFHLVQLHDLVNAHVHGAEKQVEAPTPDPVPGS